MEELLGSFSSLKQTLQGCSLELHKFSESLDLLSTRVEELKDEPAEILEECQEGLVESNDQFEKLHSKAEKGVDDRIVRIISLRDFLIEQGKEQFVRVQDRAATLADIICGELEKQLRVSLSESAQNMARLMQENLESVLREFLNFGDEFRESLEEGVGSLKIYIVEKAKSTVNEEVERTQEAAVERVIHVVMEGLLTSTMGTQITAAITPFAQYLIAAKVIAGTIKVQLDVVRSGGF